MNRRLGLACTSMACAAAIAGGWAGTTSARSSRSSKPSTITIGTTLPLTGSGAPFGKLFEDAINIAVNKINSTGGINGTKLKVVALDDQGLAAPAVMDATQLIKQDGAMVIATAYNDPPLAQYKVGERYSVPIINAGGNDPEMANKPWLWSTASMLDAEERPILQYAKAHGVKKIGILAATNYTNYDINLYHQIANQIFGHNVPLVTFDPTSTNVTTQLQQLAKDGVTAISPLASGTLTLTIAQDMSQLGLKQQVVGTGSTLTEPPNVIDQPAWNHAIASVINEPIPAWLNKAVEKDEKASANAYHIFFADVPYLVKSAVLELEQQHKTVNGAGIEAVLMSHAKSGKPLTGVNGPIVFKPNHTVAHPYTISEVVNKKFKVLANVPVGK